MKAKSRDHTIGRSALALAVVAVIVAENGRLVNVGSVRDSFAEAVSGERHGCDGDDDEVN